MAKNIKVFLELDTSKFDKNLAKSENSVKGMKKSADGLGVGLKAMAAVGATAFAFKGIVQTTARFEDLRTTLTSVTGSVKGGADAFKDISKFATTTQFGVEELTNTYIKLKTAGIEPTQALLTTFTDTAAVTTDQLGSLEAITDLFSRTVSGGLGLEELNRLADRGVPVFRILEEQLGLTRLEVAEFGKTADGAKKITDALTKGLNKEFGGATQDRLKNLSVAMSNFGIAATNAQDTFGQGFAPALNQITTQLTDFITANEDAVVALGELVGDGLQFVVDNIEPLATGLGVLIAAWGAYKVAVVAATVASSFNPVIAAVVALAAAVALIIAHWDDVKFAGREAIRLVRLGVVQLTMSLLDGLGGAIFAVTEAFSDFKKTAVAVGAGIAAALKDPFNATEAFQEAFNNTMQDMDDATSGTVRPFTATLDKLALAEAELSVVTARTSTEIQNQADATDDLNKKTDKATDNIDENLDATEDLNKAIDDYIKNLKDSGIELEKTSKERALDKKILEEQEKAAKAAGVTLAKLSKEQLDAIEALVRKREEEKDAAQAAADAIIEAEKKKQDEIKRTLDAANEYYLEAVAGADSYRQQLEMEGEQIRALTGLYGVERAVAEELYDFNKMAANDIAKLQAAEADLRANNAQAEADQVAKKIEDLRAAHEIERAAIEEVARQNAEYQRSFAFGWREAFAEFSDEATNNAKLGADVFNTFATGMSDALYDFAMTGKLSFSDLIDNMKSVIARFLADRITQKFLEFLDEAVFGNSTASSGGGTMGRVSSGGGGGGGGSSSGGGGGGSVIGSVVGAVVDKGKDLVKSLFGFADGGYIPGNKMSVVGENGPELFMPSQSGSIIPNFAGGGQGGGGVTNVTYNINATDAQSFKQLVARDPEFIYNVSQAGARRVPR